MTNWYAYRWVCDNCRAVYYYDAGICRRCGCKNLEKKVNNQRLVDELKSGKRPRKTYGPENVERETDHGPQNLKEPIHPPEEEDDDLLGKSDGETVQQSEDPDDLDDMINDILEG
jgi:ribosomal protein L40E